MSIFQKLRNKNCIQGNTFQCYNSFLIYFHNIKIGQLLTVMLKTNVADCIIIYSNLGTNSGKTKIEITFSFTSKKISSNSLILDLRLKPFLQTFVVFVNLQLKWENTEAEMRVYHQSWINPQLKSKNLEKRLLNTVS